MPPRLVRVFEHEPELLSRLTPRAAAQARDTCVARVHPLEPGEWRPPLVRLGAADLGLLVLDGLILRRVEVIGRTGVEVLGAGDIIRPWRDDVDDSASVPSTVRVKVCQATQLAILDRAFAATVALWPEVLSQILDRIASRPTALTFQLAIAQVPQLETRLLCLLWHLADRWGRVDRDGVVLKIRLSQQSLAELTSARRPSVNSALRRLESRGLIARERRGAYRLFGEPPRDVGELLRATDDGDSEYRDLVASRSDGRGASLGRQLT